MKEILWRDIIQGSWDRMEESDDRIIECAVYVICIASFLFVLFMVVWG